jgi:hypothetical protein
MDAGNATVADAAAMAAATMDLSMGTSVLMNAKK